MITVEFISSYHGVAVYRVKQNGKYQRVSWYFQTPEFYREDFATGGWNYTQDEWERTIVSKAGGIFDFYGNSVNSEIENAVRSLDR
jgi:hypothetical protein